MPTKRWYLHRKLAKSFAYIGKCKEGKWKWWIKNKIETNEKRKKKKNSTKNNRQAIECQFIAIWIRGYNTCSMYNVHVFIWENMTGTRWKYFMAGHPNVRKAQNALFYSSIWLPYGLFKIWEHFGRPEIYLTNGNKTTIYYRVFSHRCFH